MFHLILVWRIFPANWVSLVDSVCLAGARVLSEAWTSAYQHSCSKEGPPHSCSWGWGFSLLPLICQKVPSGLVILNLWEQHSIKMNTKKILLIFSFSKATLFIFACCGVGLTPVQHWFFLFTLCRNVFPRFCRDFTVILLMTAKSVCWFPELLLCSW